MDLLRMNSQGGLLPGTKQDRLVRMDDEGRLIGDPFSTSAPQPFKKALLLLDTSESMRDLNRFAQSVNGAEKFAAAALQKRYHSGLIVFGDSARLMTPPIGDLKVFGDFLKSTWVGMLGSSTNMAQAFALASDVPETSAVVVVTDGQPTDAEGALYHAGKLRERGVDIIAIGTDDADRNFLARIATRQDLALHVGSNQLQQAISDSSRLLSC